MFENMKVIPAHNFRRIYGKIPSRPLSISEARDIALELIAKGKAQLSEMSGKQTQCRECREMRFSTRTNGVCWICKPEPDYRYARSKTQDSRQCDVCQTTFHPSGKHNKYCSTECGAKAKRRYEKNRYLTIAAK